MRRIDSPADISGTTAIIDSGCRGGRCGQRIPDLAEIMPGVLNAGCFGVWYGYCTGLRTCFGVFGILFGPLIVRL